MICQRALRSALEYPGDKDLLRHVVEDRLVSLSDYIDALVDTPDAMIGAWSEALDLLDTLISSCPKDEVLLIIEKAAKSGDSVRLNLILSNEQDAEYALQYITDPDLIGYIRECFQH